MWPRRWWDGGVHDDRGAAQNRCRRFQEERRTIHSHERFVGIDERFDRVDERFDRVDAEFVKVREEMREFHTAVEARIREEHETTRRHFDVMVEKVEAAVRIVAEGHATFAP